MSEEEEFADPVHVVKLQRVVGENGYASYRFLLEDGTTLAAQDAVDDVRTRDSVKRFMYRYKDQKLVRKVEHFLKKRREAHSKGYPVPVQERVGKASESDDPDVTDWFA